MINKAIQRTQKPFILSLSIFGAVIGLSLLMIITQVYVNLNEVKQGESGAINDQFLVIKKKVTALDAAGVSSGQFSNEEINDFANQKFVKDLAPFSNGRNFEVFVEAGIGDNNGSSLAFIESVPDKFIDVEAHDWSWQMEDEYLPIIMPSSFLDMYNFGLAESMGAPKISRSMAGTLPLKITIKGNDKKQVFTGRIKAFSDRINSALVPISFINYANEEFGSGEKQDPSKIIIATDNNKNPEISKYLEDNGYEANNEQLRGTIIEKLIQPILSFTGVLCVIIILLTIVIFLLYGEILIVKSQYDIHVLSLLGFKWKDISKVFNQFFLKIYSLILLIALIIYFGCTYYINGIIKEYLVFEEVKWFSVSTFLAMLFFLGMFVFLNIANTRKHIKKIARPK